METLKIEQDRIRTAHGNLFFGMPYRDAMDILEQFEDQKFKKGQYQERDGFGWYQTEPVSCYGLKGKLFVLFPGHKLASLTVSPCWRLHDKDIRENGRLLPVEDGVRKVAEINRRKLRKAFGEGMKNGDGILTFRDGNLELDSIIQPRKDDYDLVIQEA